MEFLEIFASILGDLIYGLVEGGIIIHDIKTKK
jgi:hypothetical protein